ncbi:hypothetical protein [Actinoplanes philippinensis]|uniref:hypothetical protein n=1 Tax=Actinoplanes philippinensis TaxID=35752 RepID=UPI000B2DFF87|nr:hypothetical protein [Actinoplanes philippinensis]
MILRGRPGGRYREPWTEGSDPGGCGSGTGWLWEWWPAGVTLSAQLTTTPRKC